MTSVATARAAYFAANGFDDTQYGDPWLVLRVKGIPIGAIPNTKARQAALPLHDLHHVATGYQTTWRGESEIAAWELAAGCGKFYAAWILNLGAFALGLVIAPRRTLRAFARGRRSTTLYRTGVPADLAVRDVAELRALLKLDAADRG